MTDINPNRLMSFDRGIDNIVFTHKRDQAAQELPERRNLMPSDDNVRPQLSQLLEKPNTGRFLEECLRPRLENRDLLMPTQFADTLKGVLKNLVARADSGEGDSRILNRAVRLLKDETNLRELVASNRNALYQG